MRAHHELGLATGHGLQLGLLDLGLEAAGEPGHLDAQRLQPAHQLAKVLLGQDLRGRHERALPAGLHGNGSGQRGHHRLARAHIALQQAVHGVRPGNVQRDFFDHTSLRFGQGEGQHGQQALLQATRTAGQGRRLELRTLHARLHLRGLLGQQLFVLETLPGRVAVVFQGFQRGAWRRVVQAVKRLTQAGPSTRKQRLGHHLAQRCALQGRCHRLAQIGLRQACRGGIDRRERLSQCLASGDHLDRGVHHLSPEKPVLDLAAHPQANPWHPGILLRAIEVQKAQQQGARAIVDLHDELAALADVHPRLDDVPLHLRCDAVTQLGHGVQAGLVLVTQGQVQGQVDVAAQAQLEQGLGRHGQVGGGRS